MEHSMSTVYVLFTYCLSLVFTLNNYSDYTYKKNLQVLYCQMRLY